MKVDELQRIREAYERRDMSGMSREFSLDNPAFLFHMQEREWSMLSELKRAGFLFQRSSVLEVGAGTGHILQRFSEFGAERVVGVDLMLHRVASGTRKYRMPELCVANAASLPFGDGCFDLVSQFMCISSVLDLELRGRIASEMWRVLKPGGIFLSYDLRPPNPVSKLRFAVGSFRQRIRGVGGLQGEQTPIRPLSRAEVESWGLPGMRRVRLVSVDPRIVNACMPFRWMLDSLRQVSFLMTHYLLVITKPADHGE